MCLINRGVTRFGGYIRYFSFLVPIFSVLIIILYNYVIDKRLQKIILFIFVILMLGNIYQSSITYGKYINWKQKEDKVQRVMSYIKSIIDHDNTVIISNIGKQTFYYTKISTKEITSMHYLDSNIISLKAQNKDIVFVFNKTYHLDTSWQQFATKIKSYKGQVLWDDDIYFVYK